MKNNSYEDMAKMLQNISPRIAFCVTFALHHKKNYYAQHIHEIQMFLPIKASMEKKIE